MSGLTSTLFESSPFVPDEDKAEFAKSHDAAADGLMRLADPGFMPMKEDPSAANLGMLFLGIGAPGAGKAIGKAGGAVIDAAGAARKMFDKGVDAYRGLLKTRAETRNAAVARIDDVKTRARDLGLDELDLEMLSRTSEIESLSRTYDVANDLPSRSLADITAELAQKHSWTSRLTPARYQNKVEELVNELVSAEQTRNNVVGSYNLTPEVKQYIMAAPASRRKEIMGQLKREADELLNAHRDAYEEIRRAAKHGVPEGSARMRALEQRRAEIGEAYSDMDHLLAYLQKESPKAAEIGREGASVIGRIDPQP